MGTYQFQHYPTQWLKQTAKNQIILLPLLDAISYVFTKFYISLQKKKTKKQKKIWKNV